MKKQLFILLNLAAFALPNALFADAQSTIEVSNQGSTALFVNIMNAANKQITNNVVIEPGSSNNMQWGPAQEMQLYAYNTSNQKVEQTMWPNQLQGKTKLVFNANQNQLNGQSSLQNFLQAYGGGQSPQHAPASPSQTFQITAKNNSPHTFALSWTQNGQSQFKKIEGTTQLNAQGDLQATAKLDKINQPNVPQQEPGTCQIPSSMLNENGNNTVEFNYQKSQRAQIVGNNICPLITVNSNRVQPAPSAAPSHSSQSSMLNLNVIKDTSYNVGIGYNENGTSQTVAIQSSNQSVPVPNSQEIQVTVASGHGAPGVCKVPAGKIHDNSSMHIANPVQPGSNICSYITIDGQQLQPGQAPSGPQPGPTPGPAPAGPQPSPTPGPAPAAPASGDNFSITFVNKSPHTGWIITDDGTRHDFKPYQTIIIPNIKFNEGLTVNMNSNVNNNATVSARVSKVYPELTMINTYQKNSADQQKLAASGLAQFLEYKYN